MKLMITKKGSLVIESGLKLRLVTYLSIRKASLSIDRLVDLGLNSDDARINHVLITLLDK